MGLRLSDCAAQRGTSNTVRWQVYDAVLEKGKLRTRPYSTPARRREGLSRKVSALSFTPMIEHLEICLNG